jgi:outer membrane protein assembly factor BamB
MTHPSSRTVAPGQTATFSTSATGDGPLTYQWQRNELAISGATSASYTTSPVTAVDNGARFRVIVSNPVGSVTSNQATLSVNAATGGGATAAVDVVTYHNDVARTGQNLNEAVLTTANVNSTTFGKLRSLPVDGKVDAQPLYLAQLAIGGATRNVLYVATEHGSVYAFDADAGTLLWQVSTLGSGEVTSDTRGCDQITPEIGITATPVIDRNAGKHGVIYVVAMSKSGSSACTPLTSPPEQKCSAAPGTSRRHFRALETTAPTAM